MNFVKTTHQGGNAMKRLKKLTSIILAMVLIVSGCIGFSVSASAKTTPWYKIVTVNGNKITACKDYYDIKGNKTIKFEFAYVNSGIVYPNLFKSAYTDESALTKKDVRFSYKVYRNNKLVDSGSNLKYNSTIKIKGNTFKTCRVYVTSTFVSDGKDICKNGKTVYARTINAKSTVQYIRYRISY